MTVFEIENMRLALSTFRDGSGQFVKSIEEYMPDYRDFERVTALVCGGDSAESKAIFDVVVPTPDGLPFGISCKMSTEKKTAGFMELSNAHKTFQDEFDSLGVDWRTEPEYAGPAVVELVSNWHQRESRQFDLASSRYLVLSHDSKWREFQLHCYPLSLVIADPYADVEWCSEGKGPSTVAGYIQHGGRRHRLWQLFQGSGGQLKYYPPLEWTEWSSARFALETPPVKTILEKVEEYFPGKWSSLHP
ncbi:hypothetical protein [Candidatus Poriferisocius sp.]|uniref:hypothetical protein n=1 Tax=Candidatus Poriferisocius sp. TaxID=3101276 RepID=UPI003B027468